ncbi:flagellar biosynthetic protein FliR [Azospira sp. I13]|uniref:flagellar biosynthetic protein FliR n=1 Tax=Azospira sp. I13 TaxID=1765050 RepID=UPI000D4ACA0E|nr:flagellar biosynthetic protein FliR [Azospira sp. I13]GBG00719.1 flagellar biosynthetic protein FliR [Azospira sp. I13]
MISFTSAQLNAWIAAFIFPLIRILAFVAAAPVFNNAAVPRRVRLILGLALAAAIVPTVPPLPPMEPASGIGLAILAQQILIGLSLAFVMRLIFAGITMAGELMSFQMGLGFATLYDPQNTAQTGVVAEVVTLCATLVFLALNGHLLMIAGLADSFRTIPIATPSVTAGLWLNLAEAGTQIFRIGLLLSLPVVIALIITNLALSILSRAAPQLNLMAVGFPVTLTIGLGILALSLPYMVEPLTRLFDEGFRLTLTVLAPIKR